MFAFFPALLLLIFQTGQPVQGQSAVSQANLPHHVIARVQSVTGKNGTVSHAAFLVICLAAVQPALQAQPELAIAECCLANLSIQVPQKSKRTSGLTRDGPLA